MSKKANFITELKGKHAAKIAKPFSWERPVVKPQAAETGSTMRRLRNNNKVRSATSTIQEEYDAFVAKRRGKNES